MKNVGNSSRGRSQESWTFSGHYIARIARSSLRQHSFLVHTTAFRWYNCQWPSAYFKVIGLFDIKFLKNGVWYGKSYYRQLIGNHTLPFDWCHFWWPWGTFEGHFSLGCHFHVHFSNPWHAFASHGLPAIAELLVVLVLVLVLQQAATYSIAAVAGNWTILVLVIITIIRNYKSPMLQIQTTFWTDCLSSFVSFIFQRWVTSSPRPVSLHVCHHLIIIHYSIILSSKTQNLPVS